MGNNHRQSLGRLGEDLAVNYLIQRNYSILARNSRTPYGEIDIVAVQGDVVVFVEVKTRASRSMGPPEISITRRKEEHMRSAAEFFIQNYPSTISDWRIDVLAIQLQLGNTPPLIDHFENATHS